MDLFWSWVSFGGWSYFGAGFYLGDGCIWELGLILGLNLLVSWVLFWGWMYSGAGFHLGDGFIWELGFILGMDLFGSWVSFGGRIYLGAGFHLGESSLLCGGVGTNKAPYSCPIYFPPAESVKVPCRHPFCLKNILEGTNLAMLVEGRQSDTWQVGGLKGSGPPLRRGRISI